MTVERFWERPQAPKGEPIERWQPLPADPSHPGGGARPLRAASVTIRVILVEEEIWRLEPGVCTMLFNNYGCSAAVWPQHMPLVPESPLVQQIHNEFDAHKTRSTQRSWW